mmetsp:Transcript_12842/g.44426  ORF Transcript_12842/g.44426 Transcript_12842/m.44426 type:complete len:358 (+) Transcript_12842:414-1487(+)
MARTRGSNLKASRPSKGSFASSFASASTGRGSEEGCAAALLAAVARVIKASARGRTAAAARRAFRAFCKSSSSALAAETRRSCISCFLRRSSSRASASAAISFSWRSAEAFAFCQDSADVSPTACVACRAASSSASSRSRRALRSASRFSRARRCHSMVRSTTSVVGVGVAEPYICGSGRAVKCSSTCKGAGRRCSAARAAECCASSGGGVAARRSLRELSCARGPGRSILAQASRTSLWTSSRKCSAPFSKRDRAASFSLAQVSKASSTSFSAPPRGLLRGGDRTAEASSSSTRLRPVRKNVLPSVSVAKPPARRGWPFAEAKDCELWAWSALRSSARRFSSLAKRSRSRAASCSR